MRLLIRPLLLVLLTLLLAACSHPPFADWDATLLSPAYWVGAAGSRDPSQAIARCLAAGDYEQAQALVHAAQQSGKTNQEWQNLVPQVIEGLVAQADAELATERPERAGRLLALALQIYPANASQRAAIARSRSEIDAGIGRCADVLMQKGLIAYRAGALDRAIGDWEALLVFAPEHEPAQLAVSTARRQQKQLQTLAGGGGL